MRFGECYKILEEGGYVARAEWNGVFLWMKQKAKVKSDWCKDPTLKMLADANGGEVEAEQVLCKYDKYERKVMTGWVPQQNDLAADDWEPVTVKLENDKIKVMLQYHGIKQSINTGYVGDLFDGAEVFKKP